MTKVYDLAVKTGSYVNREGDTKNSYENIGMVMQSEKGQYMLLKRTFNPAGVPNPDDKDMVMVSMFEPKEKDGTEPKRNRPDPQSPDLNDFVPF